MIFVQIMLRKVKCGVGNAKRQVFGCVLCALLMMHLKFIPMWKPCSRKQTPSSQKANWLRMVLKSTKVEPWSQELVKKMLPCQTTASLTLESCFYRKKWHFTSRVSAQDAFTFVLLFSSKRPACSPIFLWQVVVNFLALTEIGNYFRNRRSFRKQKTPLFLLSLPSFVFSRKSLSILETL